MSNSVPKSIVYHLYRRFEDTERGDELVAVFGDCVAADLLGPRCSPAHRRFWYIYQAFVFDDTRQSRAFGDVVESR